MDLKRLMMSQQMQPTAPDYAMGGPAPDMRTAYAAMQAQQAGPAAGDTDMEIIDFINQLKPYAMNLPPKLRMKLDGLSSMIDSIVNVNTPEIGDSNTADLGAAYGKSSAGLQGLLDDQLEDVNNSGVYPRKGLLSR